MNEFERAELAVAANQALELKNNPAFANAWKALRQSAVLELVAVDATNTDEIRRIQAEIKALDGLAYALADAINRMPRKPQAVA